MDYRGLKGLVKTGHLHDGSKKIENFFYLITLDIFKVVEKTRVLWTIVDSKV